MDLPNDIFHNAFQRFSYNVELIEKRYKNKRPSGLEMDCDTGKIYQVIDAKRPRLTVEEAKEKMKTSFLAPPSLFGNSSLCSPFVDDMTASEETKLRVLKHNKRFNRLLNNGSDFSTSLLDENVNDNDVASERNENHEEEELFDLGDIFDDGDEEDAEDEDDAESEGDEYVSVNDVACSSYEKDTDSEDEFEVTEEEAAKEKGITYENVKITRALIQHLTPKSSHGRNAAASALTITSKKTPFSEETPKGRPRKERYQVADGTPKNIMVRTSASVLKGTPTTSKKIRKAASKKVGKVASEKAKKVSAMIAENAPKFTRAGRRLIPKKVYDYDEI